MPKQKHVNSALVAEPTMLNVSNAMSLSTQITMVLSQVEKLIENAKEDDDHTFAQAYLWDTIQSYAKRKSDAVWKDMEENNLIDDYKQFPPGEAEIGESRHFVVRLKVSNPVSRFKPEAMADRLAKSKYKVPTSFTLEAVELSKVPSSSNRTLTVEEKAMSE